MQNKLKKFLLFFFLKSVTSNACGACHIRNMRQETQMIVKNISERLIIEKDKITAQLFEEAVRSSPHFSQIPMKFIRVLDAVRLVILLYFIYKDFSFDPKKEEFGNGYLKFHESTVVSNDIETLNKGLQGLFGSETRHIAQEDLQLPHSTGLQICVVKPTQKSVSDFIGDAWKYLKISQIINSLWEMFASKKTMFEVIRSSKNDSFLRGILWYLFAGRHLQFMFGIFLINHDPLGCFKTTNNAIYYVMKEYCQAFKLIVTTKQYSPEAKKELETLRNAFCYKKFLTDTSGKNLLLTDQEIKQIQNTLGEFLICSLVKDYCLELFPDLIKKLLMYYQNKVIDKNSAIKKCSQQYAQANLSVKVSIEKTYVPQGVIENL